MNVTHGLSRLVSRLSTSMRGSLDNLRPSSSRNSPTRTTCCLMFRSLSRSSQNVFFAERDITRQMRLVVYSEIDRCPKHQLRRALIKIMRPVRHLILVSSPTPLAEDQRLLKLAKWMGVSTATVAIKDGGDSLQRLLDEFPPHACCLAMTAEVLAAMHKAPIQTLQKLIDGPCAELLVFGCSSSAEQRTAISWLTAGGVCGISQQSNVDALFALPSGARTFTQQLAGLNFSGGHREPIPVFELRHATHAAEVIITADERPMFVRVVRGPCQVFLLAGRALPDVDEPLSRDHGIQEHYDGLIPVLIFLRYCFRESCWHGPESTARLIIDDPLLAERYGFLDYDVLIKSIQRSNYGTSIGFIPWNYWRTSRMNASRLLGEGTNVAICIHGCDHTNKEFEAQDTAILGRKASLAFQRMESQRKRIGAPFEKVMVFPQGRFSTAAIAALRANNYLAAVNTTCLPTNIGPDDLKVGDFLRPAVTRYNGFPIFQRRYPRCLFDFAFDLFLGRPALVVEHHEYFRDGCRTLEEFVAELHKLEPTLSWPTLTAQLTRSCLKRNLSNSSVDVQFFTRRFQLANREGGPCHFLLSKHEPDSAVIERVLVDGTSGPFSFEKGFLKLEVWADPGQVRNIEIVDREQPHQEASGFGVVHNTRVLLRRGLSEFRDNTLTRHAGLLKVAKRVARRLKVTGDA